VIVNHLYGRSVADTAAMAALTHRSPWAIRNVCKRDPEGYDVKKCTAALEDEPHAGMLMSAAQAEKYLKIRANTIYQWVFRGELKPVDRDGRQPLYLAEDLLRLADRSDPQERLTCNNE
jgi:hypothetical protein